MKFGAVIDVARNTEKTGKYFANKSCAELNFLKNFSGHISLELGRSSNYCHFLNIVIHWHVKVKGSL